MAGLPYVISGLVAAGGMAAAMSTADGLLLAMANTLSHDLYYKIIDPKAEVRRRLMTSRILLLMIGAGGAAVASLKLTGILGAVAWAFCFAMSGLFVPLVLGVWWKRANRAGALAGMIVGPRDGLVVPARGPQPGRVVRHRASHGSASTTSGSASSASRRVRSRWSSSRC